MYTLLSHLFGHHQICFCLCAPLPGLVSRLLGKACGPSACSSLPRVSSGSRCLRTLARALCDRPPALTALPVCLRSSHLCILQTTPALCSSLLPSGNALPAPISPSYDTCILPTPQEEARKPPTHPPHRPVLTSLRWPLSFIPAASSQETGPPGLRARSASCPVHKAETFLWARAPSRGWWHSLVAPRVSTTNTGRK